MFEYSTDSVFIKNLYSIIVSFNSFMHILLLNTMHTHADNLYSWRLVWRQSMCVRDTSCYDEEINLNIYKSFAL